MDHILTWIDGLTVLALWAGGGWLVQKARAYLIRQRELEQSLRTTSEKLEALMKVVGEFEAENQARYNKALDTFMAANGQLVEHQRVTNIKLEGYEGNQTKAREEIADLRAGNAQLAERLGNLEHGLEEVKSFQDDVVVDWIAVLPARVAALEVEALPERVAELEAGVAQLSSGFIFDRSPSLQRIRQAAKDREKGPADPNASDAPRGR